MQQLQHYSKITAAKKQKEPFQVTYYKKSLIVEVKVSRGFIKRGLSKKKLVTLDLEVSHDLFWYIFNHAINLMLKMAKVTLMLPSTRWNHALLKECSKSFHVEDVIIKFERAAEINNGVFFDNALVNKPKILKC